MEISASLMMDYRLAGYERVVLFLQGLPDSLVGKIYLQVTLDNDDPATFVRKGCFKEAVEATLTLNRTTADVSRLQALGIGGRDQQESHQANEALRKIIQNLEKKPRLEGR
jgi:hypothetical protein